MRICIHRFAFCGICICGKDKRGRCTCIAGEFYCMKAYWRRKRERERVMMNQLLFCGKIGWLKC
jgi:hypothetical protein